MSQNIAKEHLIVFDLSCSNKKNVENARIILSFCHTSENTVYCLILNIALTVGSQQATMTNGSKYRNNL